MMGFDFLQGVWDGNRGDLFFPLLILLLLIPGLLGLRNALRFRRKGTSDHTPSEQLP
jgi:hypothetical protein